MIDVQAELQKIADEQNATEAAETTTNEVVEETIIEDSSITEEKPIEDVSIVETKEVVAEEKPVVVNDDFVIDDNVPAFDVSKHTDGEFEKVEDLIAEYKNLKGNVLTGDSLLANLDEQCIKEFNLPFAEVLAWKNTDYSKMDEFEILSTHLIMEDNAITDLEIEAELAEFEMLKKTKEEIDTMIEDGELKKVDYDNTVARFTKKVRHDRNALTVHRDSLGLDKIKIGTPSVKTEVEQPQTEEEIKVHKQNVRDGLNNFSELKINLGGKDNKEIMNFKIADADKDVLAEVMTNRNWILDRWKDEDGSINGNKAFKDGYVLNNFSKIVKAAYSEGLTMGAKAKTMKEDNITLGEGRTVQSETKNSVQAEADKLYAAMNANN